MNVFFTADHHFGHENIIRFCDRPFGSVEEMDEALVERWNERVGPDDVVYHLGDFTLGGKAAALFNRLNGVIYVLGNHWHHDRRWLPKGFGWTPWPSASRWEVEIAPPLMVLWFGETPSVPVVLCHYPLAEWDRKRYGAWHLHGHSHGKHRGEGLIMDVGVDCTGFYPVSLEEVAEFMRGRAG